MGNSGSSHQQQVTLVEGPPHSWAHSFPRATSFKVLPDRVPGQRLKLTDNGAILHNGGTISGRKPYPFEPQHKIQVYRGSALNGEDYRRSLYGSEPDLRYPQDRKHFAVPSHQNYYSNNNSDNSVKARIGRSRKKYKAPPAPQVNSADSSSPDSYHRWETSAESSDVTTPSRRSRLFKTRAETKRPSVDNPPSKYLQNGFSQFNKGAIPGQLQRSMSSPQFQNELSAKLRERAIREPPVGKAADSPHISPVLRGRETAAAGQKKHAPKASTNIRDSSNRINAKSRDVVQKLPLKTVVNGVSGRSRLSNGPITNGYGMKDMKQSSEHRIESGITKNRSKIPTQNGVIDKYEAKYNENKDTESNKIPGKPAAPVKKFYFGMEADIHAESLINGETNEVDKFAESLRKSTPVLTNTSPSESFSSDPTNDDSSAGISLKLRPTLPRKQLDIPRFSPTAAWRLLSALESPAHSEEDDLVLMEDQLAHHRLGHQLADKSGDSGISGDTSPQHQDSAHNSQVAWTPQQDLEETSSDGGLESAPVSPEGIGAAKFSPRFSLSLPRDERVPTSYSDKVQSESYQSSSFQNLKKLKRSVSGALNRNKEVTVSSLDENWLLSRSVPNLFNNSYVRRWSDTSPSSAEQDDDPSCSPSKPPSFSYLANGGHIMYLPEYKSTRRERSTPRTTTHMSKSCEDLSRRSKEQNSVINGTKMLNGYGNNGNHQKSKSKKFTFQSTIRQIERKRIAEKLSKEAEEKEKRRLRELEAMKRVEEEFQRKREREKADIRHQLRLYNLTEGGREQPDGAVLPPPPCSTQILSEYRQPRRDYRDYTPSRSDLDSISHSESVVKRETVHPEVVYKIPKNAQVYITPHHSSTGNGNGYHSVADSPRSLSSDNYRKDFAQGALPRSVASSDSELSQPNTRPTSRAKQRSRSSSPVPEDEPKIDINTNGKIFAQDFSDDKEEDVDNNEIDEFEGKEEEIIKEKNIENLIDIFRSKPASVVNNIILQPYNRNKTYKPVSFEPFGDKVAQVTS